MLAGVEKGERRSGPRLPQNAVRVSKADAAYAGQFQFNSGIGSEEKIPSDGTARAARIPERWLKYYLDDMYKNIQKEQNALPKAKGCLTVKYNEMWSLARLKKNKYWWTRSAINRSTRENIMSATGTARGAEEVFVVSEAVACLQEDCQHI